MSEIPSSRLSVNIPLPLRNLEIVFQPEQFRNGSGIQTVFGENLSQANDSVVTRKHLGFTCERPTPSLRRVVVEKDQRSGFEVGNLLLPFASLGKRWQVLLLPLLPEAVT